MELVVYASACVRVLSAACLLVFAWVFPALAGDLPKVAFAGVAYTSAAADVERLLPITHQAILRHGEARLSQDMARALARHPPAGFEISASNLASLDGSASSVAMAFAIDRETVSDEEILGHHKVLFELAGQALFFDFREKQLLYAFPITLQYIDVLAAAPSPAQLDAIADRLLVGDGASSLLKVLPEEMRSLALPDASARRLQVVEVNFRPGSEQKLPPSQRDSALIGHELTKVLASRLRLPMLPHAKGQAIAGAMPARFADGSVFNLRIPDPDYVVVVDIDDFREKVLSETPAARQQLYGAFLRVRIFEPLSSTVYFDQALRQGSTRVIPATQVSADSAAAYYETLLTSFASFADAVSGGAKPWASEQVGGREFASQLKSLKELIRTCR